jgi:hypothetical protein
MLGSVQNLIPPTHRLGVKGTTDLCPNRSRSLKMPTDSEPLVAPAPAAHRVSERRTLHARWMLPLAPHAGATACPNRLAPQFSRCRGDKCPSRNCKEDTFVNQNYRIVVCRKLAVAAFTFAAVASAIPAQAQHGHRGSGHRQETHYGHDDHRGGGGGDFAVGAVMGVVAGAAIVGAYQPPPAVVYETAPPPPPPGVVYYSNGYPP